MKIYGPKEWWRDKRVHFSNTKNSKLLTLSEKHCAHNHYLSYVLPLWFEQFKRRCCKCNLKNPNITFLSGHSSTIFCFFVWWSVAKRSNFNKMKDWCDLLVLNVFKSSDHSFFICSYFPFRLEKTWWKFYWIFLKMIKLGILQFYSRLHSHGFLFSLVSKFLINLC